ncbi:MAG: FKBP-type peptidyl-prolyl cis-trans isomerase [Oceanihabitans sp.]
MKLRKIALCLLALAMVFISCKNDDDGGSNGVPDRDRAEVYAEDLAEIETFLETHFYNYEDFDFANPYSVANDDFQIIFKEIDENNLDKTPLMEMVDYKMVTDPEDEAIVYKLYYLKIREGLGDELYASDEAFLTYEGSIFANNYVFDSKVTPIGLNLTQIGTSLSGVVTGFKEGLIEFNAAESFTDNGDGTISYHNHGIGAIFVPSGIGYFSSPIGEVDAYTPLVFKVNLMEAIHTDFDFDNIPSYKEDLDGDGDVYSDDTDGDTLPNFVDNDDDGDGVLTRDELDYETYMVNITNGETEPVFAANEYEISRETTIDSGTGDEILTIETYIVKDTNGNGTPDYLDDTI